MTDQELIDALQGADAIEFGEFELSHGGTSEYYVDKYRFETDPHCLSTIEAAFAERIDDEKLAGVALGAVPLVAATSVETGTPYAIVRKEKKEYGTETGSRGNSPTGKGWSCSKTSPPPARVRCRPSVRSGRPAQRSIACSWWSIVRRAHARRSPRKTSNSHRS